MYQGMGIFLNQAGIWLAQGQILIREQPVRAPSLAITGPNFFMALLSGVLLAFAFQLLLTNLGVAIGISALGGGSDSGESSSNSSHSDSSNPASSPSAMIRKIETGLGLATLISVSISLFFACWLAVQLSLVGANAAIGMILGLVIWATYFSLLVFVSSTTIGSLVGSVVNTATAGFQALLGTATSAIGGTGAALGTVLGGMTAKNQTVSTAEAAARAIRKELTKGLDPEGIREKLEDYVENLRPPQLDYKKIQSEIEDVLKDPRFQELSSGDLKSINRQTFIDLVSSRSDLSKDEVNRISSLIENIWHGATKNLPSRHNIEDLVNFVKEATTDQLVGDEFNQKLDGLVTEARKHRQTQEQGQEKSSEGQNSPLQLLNSGLTSSLSSMIGIVLGRTDLSDLDVQSVLENIKSARGKLSEQGEKVTQQLSGSDTFSPVRADVENYLLNTYSWRMSEANLAQEFRDVIYDPEADPSAIAQELKKLDRAYFSDLLKQRGVFTVERIEQISNSLEAIRLEAINTAHTALEQRESLALFGLVENYLLSTPKEDLTPEKIQLNFKDILSNSDVDHDTLAGRLGQFDRPTLERILNQRQDVVPFEAATLTNDLEYARDRTLIESQEVQEAGKAKVQAQWLKVQSYLRETGREELKPEGVKRDLQALIHDPQAGISALRARASHFDRDTLVQLLAERPEIEEKQVNEILDQVESVWHQVREQQSQLTGKVKEEYENAMSAIAHYLKNTGKDELNPEGIQQDLQLLLDKPQLGAQAIRMRLAEIDRDTLVQLLSQRDDLSKEEVNSILNQVQSSLQTLANAPRRLAIRAKAEVMDFESTIEDYLRHTGKEELSPEGIKRDLQELIHHPGAGLSSISERLAKFDRETMIALISEREDISEAEVTRVVDQIMGVREQILGQIQSLQTAIQSRVESIVDGILGSVKSYLNSLERPELNYEGVKHDVQLLFDDPEAGFDALRLRLGQFDQETLKALLESSPFLSQGDIDQLIGQVEASRNRVLQRAERIQRETERRIDEIKHEAQKVAEETRKAAAVAAWWLFATALFSGVAAALGGLAAVLS